LITTVRADKTGLAETRAQPHTPAALFKPFVV